MMTLKHLFLQIALLLLVAHSIPSAAHNKTKNGTESHSPPPPPSKSQGGCDFASAFSKVFAFGDSNTDAGNALLLGSLPFKLNPSIHKSGNPFCDGSLLIDYVCDALKIPPLPAYQNSTGDFSHGANFALAGTSCLANAERIHSSIHALLGKVIPGAINLQLSWYQKYLQAMVASSGSQAQGVGSHGSSGSVGFPGGGSGGAGSGGGSGAGFSFGGSSGGSSGGSGSSSFGIGGSGGSSGGSSSSGSTGSSSDGFSFGGSGGGSSAGSSSGGSSFGGSSHRGSTGSGSGSSSYGGQSGSGSSSNGSSQGSGVSKSGSVSGGSSVSGSGGISGSSSASGGGGSASGSAVSKALEDVLFWVGPIGGNDYARMYSSHNSGASSQWISQQTINQVTKLVTTLLETGAKYIVVQGLPPVGCLPATLSSTPSSDRDEHGCCASANEAVASHNDEIQQFLALLQKTFVDCTIVYADFFKAYMTVITSPEMYHIVDAFSTCCGLKGGPLNFNPEHPCGAASTAACQKAAAHVIWDGIHLTAQANKYVAEMFLNQSGYTQPCLMDVVNKKLSP